MLDDETCIGTPVTLTFCSESAFILCSLLHSFHLLIVNFFPKVHNFRRVLAECSSLADLFTLSEAELVPLLGNAPGNEYGMSSYLGCGGVWPYASKIFCQF